MNRKERALFIRKELKKLYKNPKPPLNFSNPFTLLIAVLLSAQCTDERVNIVTKDLFKVANTPKKMKDLGIKKIHQYITAIFGYALITLSATIFAETSGNLSLRTDSGLFTSLLSCSTFNETIFNKLSEKFITSKTSGYSRRSCK